MFALVGASVEAVAPSPVLGAKAETLLWGDEAMVSPGVGSVVPPHRRRRFSLWGVGWVWGGRGAALRSGGESLLHPKGEG